MSRNSQILAILVAGVLLLAAWLSGPPDWQWQVGAFLAFAGLVWQVFARRALNEGGLA